MKGHLGVSLLVIGAFVLSIVHGAPSKIAEKSKEESMSTGHHDQPMNSEQSTSLSETKSSMGSAHDLAPAPEMSELSMDHETPSPKSPTRTSMSVADKMKARREQLALLGMGGKKVPESSNIAIVKLPMRNPGQRTKVPASEHKPEQSAETSDSKPKESSAEEHNQEPVEGKVGRSMQQGRKFSQRRSSNNQNTWGNANQQQSSPSTSPSSNGNSSPSSSVAAPSKPAHSRGPMRRNQSPSSSSSSSGSWNTKQSNSPAAAVPSSPAVSQSQPSTVSGKRTWGSRKAKEMPAATVTSDNSPSAQEPAENSADKNRDARNVKMPSARNMMMNMMMNSAGNTARNKRSNKVLQARRTLVADYAPSRKTMRNLAQPESAEPKPTEELTRGKILLGKTAAPSSDSQAKATVKEIIEIKDTSADPEVAGGVVSSDLPIEKHDEQIVKKVVETEVASLKEDDDDLSHAHSASCNHAVKGGDDVIVLPKTDVDKTVTLVRRTQSFSSSVDGPLIEQYHLKKDNIKPVESRDAEKVAKPAAAAKEDEPKKKEEEVKPEDSKKSEEPKVPESAKPEDAKKEDSKKPEASDVPTTTTTTTTTTVKPDVNSTETPKKVEHTPFSKTPLAQEIDAATQTEVDAELAQSLLSLTGAMDPQAVDAALGKTRRKRNTPSMMHMTMRLPQGGNTVGMSHTQVKMEGSSGNGMSVRNMPMMRRKRSTGYGYQQKVRNSVRSSGSGYNMETVSVRITSDPVPAVRSSSYGRSLTRAVTPVRSSNYEEAPAPVVTSTYEETPELPEEESTYETAPVVPPSYTSTPDVAPPETPETAYPSGSNTPARFASRARSLHRSSAPLRSDSQMYSGSAAAPEESHPVRSSSTRVSHPVRSSSTRSRHASRTRTASTHESDITLEEIQAALKSIRSSKAHTKSLSAPLRSAQRAETHSLFDEVDTTNYYAAPAPVSPPTRNAPQGYSSQDEEAFVMDEQTYSQPQPSPSRRLPIRISNERYRRSAEKSAEPETPSPSLVIKDFDDHVLAKLGEKRPAPMKPAKDILPPAKTSAKSA